MRKYIFLNVIITVTLFIALFYLISIQNAYVPAINPTLPLSLPSNMPTLTSTPTLLPTATATTTATPLPTDTPTPSPTPTQTALPAEHFLVMGGHRQYFEIGCETNAAVDWAQYYGVQLTQYDFQYKLPMSDNPDYGFVGNVNNPWGMTPPYSYGVYAGPIADLLNKDQVKARAVKGYSLDEVKIQIARNNPVIAWVIGNMWAGVPAQYTDSKGRTTIVAAYEHVVILTGYNDNTQRIRYLNNGFYYEIPYFNFLNSWNVLGKMAVIRDY